MCASHHLASHRKTHALRSSTLQLLLLLLLLLLLCHFSLSCLSHTAPVVPAAAFAAALADATLAGTKRREPARASVPCTYLPLVQLTAAEAALDALPPRNPLRCVCVGVGVCVCPAVRVLL